MIKKNMKKFLSPLAIQEIVYLRAEKNYTNIYFKNGTFSRVSINLGKIESEYCKNLELKRMHLSYMVNINYILNVFPIEGFMKLYNNTVIPINSKYAENFAQIPN